MSAIPISPFPSREAYARAAQAEHPGSLHALLDALSATVAELRKVRP